MSADIYNHLRAVTEEHHPTLTDSTLPTLPDFDGHRVDSARVKLTGVTSLEAGDVASRIDDTVRLYVEGQVVHVDHRVDARGRIVRHHTIKVTEAFQLPWDFDVQRFED